MEETLMLLQYLGSSPWWNLKLDPYTEGNERPKKEAVHSRLVDGRFNKQRNLDMSLILGSCKTSRSLHPSPET